MHICIFNTWWFLLAQIKRFSPTVVTSTQTLEPNDPKGESGSTIVISRETLSKRTTIFVLSVFALQRSTEKVRIIQPPSKGARKAEYLPNTESERLTTLHKQLKQDRGPGPKRKTFDLPNRWDFILGVRKKEDVSSAIKGGGETEKKKIIAGQSS